MAEQFLDGAQVAAAREEMCGEGMAQRVRRRGIGQAERAAQAFHGELDDAGRQRPAAGAEEEGAVRRQVVAEAGEARLQGEDGGAFLALLHRPARRARRLGPKAVAGLGQPLPGEELARILLAVGRNVGVADDVDVLDGPAGADVGHQGEYGADLRHVYAVIDALVPRLTTSAVLVGKSTVPVGTAAELNQRAAALAPQGVDVEIAWNPEFLREGYAVQDTLNPDRIVLGVNQDSTRAETAVRELYGPMLEAGVPFLVTDLQTAELVKVSANAFLATKISFINAISEVCEAAGADVSLLADALGYDPRIGRQFLNAGLGFGGGCLPKDIRAFMARAGELGADQALTFLREVDSINMRRRTRMVELTSAACGGSLLGANIAVLGAAFKPESDDVRDSPALNVAGQLQLNGAAVNVYDPKALDNAQRLFPTLNYAVSVEEACERADAVLQRMPLSAVLRACVPSHVLSRAPPRTGGNPNRFV